MDRSWFGRDSVLHLRVRDETGEFLSRSLKRSTLMGRWFSASFFFLRPFLTTSVDLH